MKKNGQWGFTFIDTMIVMSILGILVTIVLASTSRALSLARDAKRIANLYDLQKALEGYYAAYGQYPTRTGYSSEYFCSNSLREDDTMIRCKANSACKWIPNLREGGIDTDPLNIKLGVPYITFNNSLLNKIVSKILPRASACTWRKQVSCNSIMFDDADIYTWNPEKNENELTGHWDWNKDQYFYFYLTQKNKYNNNQFDSYVIGARLETNHRLLKENTCVPMPLPSWANQSPQKYMKNSGCPDKAIMGEGKTSDQTLILIPNDFIPQ